MTRTIFKDHYPFATNDSGPMAHYDKGYRAVVCVEACGGALFYGTRREIIAEARKRIAENPGLYVDKIYGETVAGGTGYLYLSPIPHEQLGFDKRIQNSSYPALTKGFLYAVPSVFVLVPTLLLGIHKATKSNQTK